LSPGLQVDGVVNQMELSACRPGLLIMERAAGERRIRIGYGRFYVMRGRRKKAAGGSKEALRKYGQEEGCGIKTEVVWERGDPVWTMKNSSCKRLPHSPDRVSGCGLRADPWEPAVWIVEGERLLFPANRFDDKLSTGKKAIGKQISLAARKPFIRRRSPEGAGLFY